MSLQNIPPMSVLRERLLNRCESGPDTFEFYNSGAAAAAFIALAPGETISEVSICKITGTTGTTNVVMGIEGVSTTDQASPLVPNGTYLLGGTAKTAVFNGSTGLSTGVNWLPLLVAYTNNTGDTQIVAITVRYSGSGGDFSGSARLKINSALELGTFRGFPLMATRSSGSSAFSSISGVNGFPMIAARNASGVLVGGTCPILLQYSEPLVVGSYMGNKWTVGFGCRLKAVAFSWYPGDEDGSCALRVYVNDALVDNITIREDQVSNIDVGSLTGNTLVEVNVNPTTLAVGDVVRIVLECLGDLGETVGVHQFSSSADRLAMLNGEDMMMSAYDGTWVDTNTRLLQISPIIDRIEVGSGGGGGTSSNAGRAVVYKNVDSQWVTFRLVDSAGDAITGATLGQFTFTLAKCTTASGTVSSAGISPGAISHLGDGIYGIRLSQEQTNCDLAVLTIEHSTGVAAPVSIETIAQVAEVTIKAGTFKLGSSVA